MLIAKNDKVKTRKKKSPPAPEPFTISVLQMSKMYSLQGYPNALQTQYRVLMIDLTERRGEKKG